LKNFNLLIYLKRIKKIFHKKNFFHFFFIFFFFFEAQVLIKDILNDEYKEIVQESPLKHLLQNLLQDIEWFLDQQLHGNLQIESYQIFFEEGHHPIIIYFKKRKKKERIKNKK